MDLKFITVQEFAKRLCVSREQVYEWLKEGTIRGIRVNKTPRSPWRIPFTELQRLHAEAYNEVEDV